VIVKPKEILDSFSLLSVLLGMGGEGRSFLFVKGGHFSDACCRFFLIRNTKKISDLVHTS
jgi:hypothetical protein